LGDAYLSESSASMIVDSDLLKAITRSITLAATTARVITHLHVNDHGYCTTWPPTPTALPLRENEKP